MVLREIESPLARLRDGGSRRRVSSLPLMICWRIWSHNCTNRGSPEARCKVKAMEAACCKLDWLKIVKMVFQDRQIIVKLQALSVSAGISPGSVN
jgi:hypothetical protein